MSTPQPRMRGMVFEEMEVGSAFSTAKRTITEHDLMTFVTLLGFNEPLFWDATHAAEAGYRGRLVPGALTYGIAEGLVIQTHAFHGTGMAFLGMELTVRAPVYVGDTIHAVVETTAARPSSRPGRGIVTSRITVYNQDGDEVLVFTPTRMVRGRDFEARS